MAIGGCRSETPVAYAPGSPLTGARTRPVGVLLLPPLAAEDQVDQLTHRAVGLDGVPQRKVGVDPVPISAALASDGQIASLLQLGHDPLDRAFRDPDAHG